MFFSGYVKLATSDPLWWKLSALSVHFETQPIPTPLSWYLHHLPLWIQSVSCAGMFAIELVIPFFLFFPRRPRFAAGGAIILFMCAVALSGNYTFFNLLAIALCIPLLDDAALRRFFPKRLLRQQPQQSLPGSRRRRASRAIAAAAAILLMLNVVRWGELFFDTLPSPVRSATRWAGPFCIVNSYGLFRVMTNPRYEIVIEGSQDGSTWSEYEFKYKPGNVLRALPWVEPHQPRLDWQMWFAALGNYRQHQWFVNLCARLLQGESPVLDLLNAPPFDAPPRYVRALLYEYHFTGADEREKSGAWWRRELKGLYLPPISLKQPVR